MEKVWTTAFLPPSINEVSELSSSALKIISYLLTPGKLKFIEENHEAWHGLLKPTVTSSKCFFGKDEVHIPQEEGQQQSVNEFSTTTSRLYNLDESADMFDDSLTSNKTFVVKSDIINPIKCMSLVENSNKAAGLSSMQITNYFPVIKKVISGSTIADEQPPDSNNFIRIKKHNLLTNHSLVKQNLKMITNPTNGNKYVFKNGEKSQKCSSIPFMNSYKILTKPKNMKNKKISSAMDFYGLSLEKNETIRELPYHFPLISSKTSSCNNFSNRKRPNIGKCTSRNTVGCLSIHKSGETSGQIIDNKVNEVITELPMLTNILYLNHDNIETANKVLFDKDLTEIGFTVCYREGFCLLNKPTVKDKCFPNGLLLCSKYLNDHIELIFLSSDGFRDEKLRSIIVNVLGSVARKVCYEAQAFILFMLDNIPNSDKKACYDWCILDPLVAVWLIDPDSPPCSFDGLLKNILFSKQLKKEDNWLFECCLYLKYQSQAMEHLYSQLLKLKLWEVFLHLETQIIPILAVLETSNIVVNVDILRKMRTILQEKLNSLETVAEKMAGHKFSLKSPLQISKVLYEEMRLDRSNKITENSTTRKGKKSTSESVLKLLGDSHPLPHLILEYRQLWKLKSSYIDIILEYGSKKQSVAATWELCATATGRITSRNPNLQAIPKRPVIIEIGGKKLEFNLRSCFVARKGYIFISADFQHIELRIFAHLAKDKILTDLLNKEDDIFSSITKIRLQKKVITTEERDQTKTLVYALIYGAGLKKLAGILSVEESKVEGIKNSLYEIFPSLHNFRKQILSEVRKSKVLTTLSGRRRIFHDIDSRNLALRNSAERKAINFIIQGSAADICKFTMLKINMKMRDKEFNGRLMLQIHDELLWEVETTSYKNMISLVREVMESNKFYWSKEFHIQIPLPMVITSGKNWGNMKSTEIQKWSIKND